MFLKKQRKLKNFINDPTLQLRFAGSTVMLLVLMVASVIVYSHFFLQGVLIEIFETPEVPAGAFLSYESMIGEYFFVLFGIMSFLTIICIGYIVIETHKIAGAKYAVLKHIKENMQSFDFDKDIKLRDGDFLQDVASELNVLSELIQKKVPILPASESEQTLVEPEGED